MYISAECWYLKFQILDHKPTFYNLKSGLKPEKSFLFGDDKDSGEGLEPHFTIKSYAPHFNLQKLKSQN